MATKSPASTGLFDLAGLMPLDEAVLFPPVAPAMDTRMRGGKWCNFALDATNELRHVPNHPDSRLVLFEVKAMRWPRYLRNPFSARGRNAPGDKHTRIAFPASPRRHAMAIATTNISTAQRLAGYAGVAALVLSVYMSAAFGWQMSAAHAATLAVVSIMAAILWPIADAFRRDGSRVAAGVITAAAVVMISAEWFSHVGYTIGARVRNNDEARVVNAVHSEAQESIIDDRKNLAMWREQLAKLQQEHAWAATVSADGLRASLASATKAIDLEAGRGGCKSRCLTLMKEKASLEERIAIAERSSDLAKRIEATQRILDGKRETGAKTEFKHSATVAQTSFVAKLVSQDLNPAEGTKTWVEIAIGLFLATVSTILPAIGAFVWFRERGPTAVATVPDAPLVPVRHEQAEHGRHASAPPSMLSMVKDRSDKAISTTTKTIADIRNELRRVAKAA